MPKEQQPTYAFTTKYKGTTNRIITEVVISAAFDHKNPPDPLPPQLATKALWDTGATKSVITKGTADALGLTPVGTGMVNHAGGSAQCNQYIVNIILPNRVGFPGVMVSECVNTVGDFGVIIGMDIITKGDLAITNVGKQTIVSFRYPSLKVIDYVVETNRTKYAGVGRNAPCPCGKRTGDGRPNKFKNCCGKAV